MKNTRNIYYWLRVINDMTRQEVADALLISTPYIVAIETGNKKPSKRLSRDYAKLFNAPDTDLCKFEETFKDEHLSSYLYKLLLKFTDCAVLVEEGNTNE